MNPITPAADIARALNYPELKAFMQMREKDIELTEKTLQKFKEFDFVEPSKIESGKYRMKSNLITETDYWDLQEVLAERENQISRMNQIKEKKGE